MHVTQSITVNRSPEDVYSFWRDFNKMPIFMGHLESVEVNENGISHWRAQGPAGMTVEWDAHITEDKPNQFIAWRSLAGSDVDHTGAVYFEPALGGQGTEVRVEVDYDLPAGKIGEIAIKFFGQDPAHQLHEDLQAFKQVMENGEEAGISNAATLQGTPHSHTEDEREGSVPK